MPLSASIPPAKISRKPVHATPKTNVGEKEFSKVSANVVAALTAYEAEPAREEARLEVRRSLRNAADVIAQFSRQSPQESHVTQALSLIRTVADSGVWDHPLEATEIELMSEWSRR